MQATSLANGTEKHPATDWNAINWHEAERSVRNLRQRIFRATQAGDWKKVRSLQKLMLRSRANTLVSVRRVTQTNVGKNTAGVAKVVIKTPDARGRFVDLLMTCQPWQANPTRRVYIPKANNKLRPLGIPTVLDRCLQARVKNALEPSWEARFEGSSYGFRPGRGCHDAIAKLYNLARPNKRKKWVFDADVKGAFDNIDHTHLLKTIGEVPGKELIKQWLKAGYVDQNVFYETKAGTPQGGVISPLLANIALHGMEEALGVKHRRGQIEGKRAVVRYADDFVVFCESKEDAEAVKEILTRWLDERGLMLSPEKTKIVHLTEGFDFVGFNIRHYKAPLTSKSGYKLLIKPSKKSVKNIREKLKEKWLKLLGQDAQTIANQLNPVIRGWANYFRIGVASKTFHDLDEWMFHRELRYTRRTHPNKPWYWRKQKYWGKLTERGDNWVFGDKQTGANLMKFRWIKIERHVLVKGTASPDDPSLREYWIKRAEARAKDLTPREQKIAKNQNNICPACKETLFNGEEVHVHHIKPKSQGGKDTYSNFIMVHLYCHQQVHSGKSAKPAIKELLKSDG